MALGRPFPAWLQSPPGYTKGFGSLSVLSLGPHQKVAPSQNPQSFQISSYWSQARWSFLLQDSPWPSPNGCAISKLMAQVSLPCLPFAPLPGPAGAPSSAVGSLTSLSLTHSSPATPASQGNSPVLWERVWSGAGTGHTGALGIWGFCGPHTLLFKRGAEELA